MAVPRRWDLFLGARIAPKNTDVEPSETGESRPSPCRTLLLTALSRAHVASGCGVATFRVRVRLGRPPQTQTHESIANTRSVSESNSGFTPTRPIAGLVFSTARSYQLVSSFPRMNAWPW